LQVEKLFVVLDVYYVFDDVSVEICLKILLCLWIWLMTRNGKIVLNKIYYLDKISAMKVGLFINNKYSSVLFMITA